MYIRDLLHKLWRRFRKQDKRDVISTLCENIIIDILCKLPMETLLECRLVCPQWYSLISSEEFAKIHLERGVKSVTTIVLFGLIFGGYIKSNMFFVDDLGKTSTMVRVGVSQLPADGNLNLLGSCNGMLLLFASGYKLYNPTTEEVVTLSLPTGSIFDLFWDELNHEYKILLFRKDGENFHYFTYGLRSKLKRRLGTFRFRPCDDYKTVKLPKAICWTVHWILCSECIMVFETETERLYVIGHPGSCNEERVTHLGINLLVMDGKLVFSQLRDWMRGIREIWVLEDLVNMVWVKCQVINLKEEFRHFRVKDLPLVVQLLNIVDGELLILWTKGVFWYNIRSKRVRKICNEPDVTALWSPNRVVALTHMRTFVSPKFTLQ